MDFKVLTRKNGYIKTLENQNGLCRNAINCIDDSDRKITEFPYKPLFCLTIFIPAIFLPAT